MNLEKGYMAAPHGKAVRAAAHIYDSKQSVVRIDSTFCAHACTRMWLVRS
jgi:hypothetical protein